MTVKWGGKKGIGLRNVWILNVTGCGPFIKRMRVLSLLDLLDSCGARCDLQQELGDVKGWIILWQFIGKWVIY